MKKSFAHGVSFRVEGLSLEKLLQQAIDEGLHLQHLSRKHPKVMLGWASTADYTALLAMTEDSRWSLTPVRTWGISRHQRLFHRRSLLLLGVMVFLTVAMAVSACVWRVDIEGGMAYRPQIEAILTAHDVRTGRFRFTLDREALHDALLRELPGLSWVSVDMRGTTLQITCQEAVLGIYALRQAGDMLAKKDGIIISVETFAGTPVVQAGDMVRQGDVLIRAEERAWGEAQTPIPADGLVWARVWTMADVVIPESETITTPTGRMHEMHTLNTPFFTLPLGFEPDYECADVDIRNLSIGGTLPIVVQITRYEEVILSNHVRNATELIEEAQRAALWLAMEKVSPEAEMVDKRVEYSMIKGVGCRALAVIETRELIGAR